MVQFKLCNVCKKSFPSAAIPHHLTYCGVKQVEVVVAEPEIEAVVSEPEVVVVAEPEVVVAEPEVAVEAEPEVVVAEPEVVVAEPEVAVEAEPEVATEPVAEETMEEKLAKLRASLMRK